LLAKVQILFDKKDWLAEEKRKHFVVYRRFAAVGGMGGEMAAASRGLSGGIAYFADEAFMFSMKISKFAAENARNWAAPRKRIKFLQSACAFFATKNH